MTEKELKMWSLTNKEGRLGTVYQVEKGFIFAHQGKTDYFTSKKTLQDYVDTIKGGKLVPLVFNKPKEEKISDTVFDYPADGKTYNHLIHVKYKAPVYTKEPNSKCFFAAGWYAVNIDGSWTVEFCPKLLVINRNPFKGPFKDESEARTALSQSQSSTY